MRASPSEFNRRENSRFDNVATRSGGNGFMTLADRVGPTGLGGAGGALAFDSSATRASSADSADCGGAALEGRTGWGGKWRMLTNNMLTSGAMGTWQMARSTSDCGTELPAP